ncbi:MAG: phosphotriesterase family protein [Infirmifilum uzonense]|jgi:phosphotriesterase-related protein|uniref:phosphotriesterase family protein n=1 Tax=Infirmifilum TaxID=2856573 RepID=UPI003C74624A
MTILTARGPVSDDELGYTNLHIHLVAMPPAWLYKTPTFSNDPDYILSDLDKAVEELKLYHASGGQAAVDATCRDYGRNPKAMVQVVERVPEVKLVLVTGFNRGIYLEEWYYTASEDKLAELFASEVKNGIEGTPLRAGLIKIGADYMRILPVESKGMRAAASAHLSTGAPIVVHTTLGTAALEILELLERQGVDPASVIFYHVDRNLDVYYWEEIASRGSYLVLDQIGKVKYAPESARALFILNMVRRGFERHILLGTDIARRSEMKSYGGGPGLDYLFGKFVPYLRKVFEKEGVEAGLVEKFVLENPRRALRLRK